MDNGTRHMLPEPYVGHYSLVTELFLILSCFSCDMANY
jgi:hypothetical protein